jgi:TolB-like protein/DNA-binding winged helix-turn-helix (wHTH) protein/tetratricopeptide (TPR) repeat protein
MMLLQRVMGGGPATQRLPAVPPAEHRPEQPVADVAPHERGVLAFGPFKLDPLRRTLLRDGVPVPLTTRLFETLLYLARHPERLVTTDELEKAVWRGRVVEEGNLRKAISSLRKALHTGTQGESYIVTIAGRGFQFAVPVALEPYGAGAPAKLTASDPTAAAEPPAATRRSWHHSQKLQVGIATLLLAVAVAIWSLASRRAGDHAFSPPPHSVAVLPFVNMSGDSRQDYFSDGLADELTNTLSRVAGLHVAARTSAFSFKGSTSTIGEIGHRLDVSAILEGAVRRDGQRVHIAVQLIDTRTGFQFWSRSYDRDRFLDDMLKVQTIIAETVSASLEMKLMHADAERLTTGGTHNAQAFDAYLRGMNDSAEHGEANIRQAITDFSAAIALDPTYAQAFAGRAVAHYFLVIYGYETDAQGDKREAAAAAADADTAINLAPMLAEAHRVKSLILFDALAFRGSAEEMAIASDLAPDDAIVAASHATIEARLGHNAAAMAAARHAIALDPLNPSAYQRLGEALFWTRHFDEALEAFGHATAVDKHPSRVNLSWTALAYLARGEPSAAEHICVGGKGWTDDACLAMVYHALGRQTEAETHVTRLQQFFGDRAAYIYAEIYAQWGRPAQAMRWLETAYKLRDSGLGEMKVSPFLDPIRKITEVGEIERQLNFPP